MFMQQLRLKIKSLYLCQLQHIQLILRFISFSLHPSNDEAHTKPTDHNTRASHNDENVRNRITNCCNQEIHCLLLQTVYSIFKHFEVTGKLEASHADNSVRKFDQAEIFALLNIARAIDSKLDESQLKNTKPFVEFPCLQQRYLVSWPNSVQASMLLRQSQNLPKSINWKECTLLE
ncbi:Hypothetical_protein [Hexamita inflata]|uniref:Hypothetical_protein n=1 Tax=Hexamita inflata TaxID=28002 RepID=A0AA86RDT6_9EUKA|nr:Hypothetical protein HINF_LOCUS58898 [Hexamita inflata]